MFSERKTNPPLYRKGWFFILAISLTFWIVSIHRNIYIKQVITSINEGRHGNKRRIGDDQACPR